MEAEEFYKDHFGHTSQHVSMDKIFVCMELYAKEYANQRVIEELEESIKDVIDYKEGDNVVVDRILSRLISLKLKQQI